LVNLYLRCQYENQTKKNATQGKERECITIITKTDRLNTTLLIVHTVKLKVRRVCTA
jgi:hypothetical protein